jgi:hypothetical protein
MNEQQLRGLVRDIVARRLAERGRWQPPVSVESGAARGPSAEHPSHTVYVTVVNTGDACILEPNVSCDHCGYCKSHGH